MTPTLINAVRRVARAPGPALGRAGWRRAVGAALAISVALVVLTGGLAFGQSTTPSPPAADNFASAPKLHGPLTIQVTGNNRGFTKQPGEPNLGGNASGASAWYRWTPADTAPVVIETCGSKLDTLLAVYTGNTLGSLREVTSDDNSCGDQSKVGFTANSGTTYRIAVDGAHGAEGAFQLELRDRNEPLAPLRPFVAIANAIVTFFHDNVGLSWGLAIVFLTIVTRLAILPLSLRQIRSMRALQALQPQIKAIQQRYKDDRQRQQRELMEFYKTNKINPFASCVPLLLQLPIFIALFYLLRGDEFQTEIHGAGWLGIPNLSDPATGATLIILLVLYFVTMVGSTSIMAASAEGTQRLMMFALPVIFTPLIISFPAGLIVYWITTNLWTMGQQAVVKRIIPPPAQASPEVAKAAKKPPPPPRKKKRRR